METQFKNIDPDALLAPELRATVQTLWTSGDLGLVRVTVQRLLQQGDALGQCAVFDLYSYRCTTNGEWLSEAFAGLLPSMIAMARDVLQQVWSEQPLAQPALRDNMVASGMHMIWRAVEMEDAPRVLRSLRTERHWSIVWPSVSAARFMRGNDPAFDRQVVPLLIDIAKRPELSTLIHQFAIEALGASPSREDLELLATLLRSLPVPQAASCALILLKAGGEYPRLVRETARHWPPCDEYPVPMVLERLDLPMRRPP